MDSKQLIISAAERLKKGERLSYPEAQDIRAALRRDYGSEEVVQSDLERLVVEAQERGVADVVFEHKGNTRRLHFGSPTRQEIPVAHYGGTRTELRYVSLCGYVERWRDFEPLPDLSANLKVLPFCRFCLRRVKDVATDLSLDVRTL